ncbi:N-acetyltransferase family protein [Primorskyibacter sp. 2E107]|uniref:GNAT family N-acetyltransferase n=1 Tax=Primorskyibacter sp. 2E107 TaxID=3403458 RepID=UPI003AF51C35
MIRSAEAADARAIARVHVQAWQETYRGLLPDALIDAQSYEKRLVFWQGLSEHPDAKQVFVAAPGAEIVGFASVDLTPTRDARIAQVDSLYVLQAHHGNGYGRALLRACFETIEAQGIHRAWVEVLDSNAPARRFYEHMGAELTGEDVDPRGFVHVIYQWPDLRRTP